MPESVQFFTSGGLKLAGDLYAPGNDSGDRYPAVVLCQGLSGVRGKVLPGVAGTFASSGFLVLAFDYRGFGDGEGERGRLFPIERVEDALSALAFLRSCSKADPLRIGVYGLSYGGATALCAAALDRTVRCVAAVSGAVDGEDLMRGLRTNDEWIAFKKRLEEDRIERAATGKSALVPVTEIVPFSKTFWKRYKELDSEQHSESIPQAGADQEVAAFTLQSAEAMARFEISRMVGKISPSPALFIQGEDDDVVAVEDVLKVFRRAGQPKRFVSLPGCDHIDLDHGPGFERQVGLSLEWFERYL